MKQGTVIAGKFLLEQKLAEGGMGSVWVARHLQLNVPVAIKFMAASLSGSPALRARFEREAQASALLQSPHVVRVLDYGFDLGAPYIVMELLRGETLGARLKRERRMSLPRAAAIVQQCAKALRKAHEAGIVHRDLKPQNIFLAVDDEDEVVKIVDFGIAKVMGGDTGETTTGSILGSPLYMSPEQVRRGREADHRTDLWSLGVVVYRMITGELPFTGSEMGDVIVKICTDPVPPPSSRAPGLPPSVDAFFARALARDPNQRFQSALEFSQAFTSIVQQGGAIFDGPAERFTLPYRRAAGSLPEYARQGGAPFPENTPAPSGPVGRDLVNTPPAQALSVAIEGSGTLTNATSDSDIRRAAARAVTRTRVLAIAGTVSALVGIAALIIVPNWGPPGPPAAGAASSPPPATATMGVVGDGKQASPEPASTAPLAAPVASSPAPAHAEPSSAASANAPKARAASEPGGSPDAKPRARATPTRREAAPKAASGPAPEKSPVLGF